MAFVLGVFHIWCLPDLSWVWGVLTFYGLLVLANWIKQNTFLTPVLFLFLGLLLVGITAQWHISQQLKSPKYDQHIKVQILGLVKSQSDRHQIVAKDTSSSHKYLLNHYSDDTVPWQSGDVLSLVVNLKPPHGTANPVGFDRERWLFRKHIAATGTIKTWKVLTVDTWNPLHHVNRWRAEVAKLWQASIEDRKVSALLMALSVGDKSHFDQEDFKRFQNTGTAHLVAISGLHIGMMAAVGYGLGWLFFACWPQERITRPQIQAMSAWVLAATYAALAGLAVPTLRALLMLTVYLYFQFIKRKAYAWDVWSLSLFLVVLFDPLGVLDFGLFLSFGAVAVLILVFQGQGNRHDENKLKWHQWIKAQWVLLLGLMPMQLLMLGRVTWVAPLVNMMAIPLMTVAIVPLLFMVLMWQFLVGKPPEFLMDILVLLCELFYWILDLFESLPWVSMDVPSMSWWQWLFLMGFLLLMLLPRVIPQKFWAFFLLLPVVINTKESLPKGFFKAQFFDVGQGLSVAISTRNHDMLYDLGAAYDSGFNWAEAVVLPALKIEAIKHLDAVVVSHQDNDHAGGLPFLKELINIEKVYGSTEGQISCVKGVHWQWDEVTFEVLSPYNLIPYLKNNSSCVLRVSSVHGSLLLTGDIESAVEYRLLSQSDKLQSDVMLMPHHGSKTSSTAAFIEQVSPQWVVNSSGKYNPFNHPATEVMERYEMPVFDTQQLGQVTASNYPVWHFHGFREDFPKLWRNAPQE
ncbi:DNA internalization-related competence protein ComEC/Rec2 [Marinicella rhabdoformis]|uniref:DNA internalization-related competence protein ComEC/Rec2 n=1 Tax=Marinicella rhabdoformis TaxID=2580566 RepID=UPI0015CFF023|nr:DNA internalization-related competence protein ComEC/Rec2 [Marinicella rhabdoformis]